MLLRANIKKSKLHMMMVVLIFFFLDKVFLIVEANETFPFQR